MKRPQTDDATVALIWRIILFELFALWRIIFHDLDPKRAYESSRKIVDEHDKQFAKHFEEK